MHQQQWKHTPACTPIGSELQTQAARRMSGLRPCRRRQLRDLQPAAPAAPPPTMLALPQGGCLTKQVHLDARLQPQPQLRLPTGCRAGLQPRRQARGMPLYSQRSRARQAMTSAWLSFRTSPQGLRAEPPMHLVPVPSATTCMWEHCSGCVHFSNSCISFIWWHNGVTMGIAQGHGLPTYVWPEKQCMQPEKGRSGVEAGVCQHVPAVCSHKRRGG